MGDEAIRSFKDLKAWQEAHKLVLLIYKTTKNFPKEEVFGITNQMRRAAVSVTSNIAEGFSRTTKKDKYQFYTISKGSLTELESQVFVSRDLHYMDEESCGEVLNQIVTTGKLITGLQQYLRS